MAPVVTARLWYSAEAGRRTWRGCISLGARSYHDHVDGRTSANAAASHIPALVHSALVSVAG